MGGPRTDPRTRDRQSSARLGRDDALRRVSLTRRVVIGAAVALTAGIAAFVSAVAPGKTLGSSSRALAQYRAALAAARTRAAGESAAASQKMPPLESPSQLGLVAGAAPQPAPSQPQVQNPPPRQPQAAPVQPAPPTVVTAPPVVVSGGS